MTETCTEQALLLGRRQSLVGITCQPALALPNGLPAVVILNAGIVHRVGPNRMSVRLARALAAAGHVTLRFDLSGIGDSEPRGDGLAPLESSLADIREVLDGLEASRGIRRVVLVGLCSGADHALLYGGTDRRVVGLVLLDPSLPRTPRYYLHHYGSRLLNLQSWLHGLGRLAHRVAARPASAPAPQSDPELTIQSPQVRAYLEAAYRRAVEQDVQFLAVLTAGRPGQHNYRTQLLDAFAGVRFGRQLQLEYFQDADHTFSRERDRDRLVELVTRWSGGTAFASRTAPSPEPAGGLVATAR